MTAIVVVKVAAKVALEDAVVLRDQPTLDAVNVLYNALKTVAQTVMEMAVKLDAAEGVQVVTVTLGAQETAKEAAMVALDAVLVVVQDAGAAQALAEEAAQQTAVQDNVNLLVTILVPQAVELMIVKELAEKLVLECVAQAHAQEPVEALAQQAAAQTHVKALAEILVLAHAELVIVKETVAEVVVRLVQKTAALDVLADVLQLVEATVQEPQHNIGGLLWQN